MANAQFARKKSRMPLWHHHLGKLSILTQLYLVILMFPVVVLVRYVFCYQCIIGHLRRNHGEQQDQQEQVCPVTGTPMDEEDLIRIFDHDN